MTRAQTKRGGASMDVAQMRRVVEEMYAAWNRKDEDGAIAPLAEGVRLIHVPYDQVLVGRDEAKRRFRVWCGTFPDGRMTVENIIVDGDTVVVQLTNEGTQDGPLGELPASNKRAKTRRVAVLRFNSGGKIEQVEHYFDRLSLLQQLGHTAQRT
jgi:steroid delta-isomerase-like uncharacterized protein